MSDEKIDSVVLADGYWKDIQDELNVQDYGRDVVTEDVLCEATIVIKVSTIVPVAYRKGERNEAAIRRVVMKEAQYRVDSERRGGGSVFDSQFDRKQSREWILDNQGEIRDIYPVSLWKKE